MKKIEKQIGLPLVRKHLKKKDFQAPRLKIFAYP